MSHHTDILWKQKNRIVILKQVPRTLSRNGISIDEPPPSAVRSLFRQRIDTNSQDGFGKFSWKSESIGCQSPTRRCPQQKSLDRAPRKRSSTYTRNASNRIAEHS